jgi:hypothetical protein
MSTYFVRIAAALTLLVAQLLIVGDFLHHGTPGSRRLAHGKIPGLKVIRSI